MISQVDTDLFTRTYFTHCMRCTTCDDQCCSYGVDVDLENKARIEARAEEIERFTGIPRDRFFTEQVEVEPEYPGGGNTRTTTNERGCVFLTPGGRGCMLHAFSLEKGIDYHELKPLMSSLFPCTFGDGALLVSEEVEEGSLACLGPGPSVYDGVRAELAWYFGPELVAELDILKMTRGIWDRAPSPIEAICGSTEGGTNDAEHDVEESAP